MEVVEMRMLGWISEVVRKDRIRDDYVKRTVKMGSIGKTFKKVG